MNNNKYQLIYFGPHILAYPLLAGPVLFLGFLSIYFLWKEFTMLTPERIVLLLFLGLPSLILFYFGFADGLSFLLYSEKDDALYLFQWKSFRILSPFKVPLEEIEGYGTYVAITFVISPRSPRQFYYYILKTHDRSYKINGIWWDQKTSMTFEHFLSKKIKTNTFIK